MKREKDSEKRERSKCVIVAYESNKVILLGKLM